MSIDKTLYLNVGIEQIKVLDLVPGKMINVK